MSDLVGQVNEVLAPAASGLRGALVDLPSSASLYRDVPSLPTMTEVKVEALRSPAHRHTELLSDLVQSQAEMVQSQTQMVEAQRVMIARQDEELTHHRQRAQESRRREAEQQAALTRQRVRAQAQVARANAQDARATRANLIALASLLVAVLAILQTGAGGVLLGWVWSERTRALLVDLATWGLTGFGQKLPDPGKLLPGVAVLDDERGRVSGWLCRAPGLPSLARRPRRSPVYRPEARQEQDIC